jgi:phenol/toluene 2-monooxygenase (NADH) P2/A2
MTGTATSEQLVFIALQANSDTISIIEAIMADNPRAVLNEYPAMVKIDAPGRLVIKRETIEEALGRSYDLREIQLNLISLAGAVDESEDEFILEWKRG